MNTFKRLMATSRWNDSAILFIRIFVGAMMLTHGISKVQNFNFMYETFPDLFGIGRQNALTLVALVETACSCLLIMGLWVRLSALVLAGGMFIATFVAFPDQPFAQGELSFMYMGIYIFLLISGGGKYSLDKMYARMKIHVRDFT